MSSTDETIAQLNSRTNTVFVVTTVTIILSSVFVAARLVSRFAIVKSKTWDDWFIIIAWIVAFALSFAIDYGTTKGLGKHDVEIEPQWLPSLRKSEYAFTILYNPALMATKNSILIFYLRMSRNTQTVLRVASYVTLVVVNLAGVVLTFLNAFQCSPVHAAWTDGSNAKCLSIITLYSASAPVNIITDLAILVLPIPVLTGMRLPHRQKAILVFTFAMGIFVAIVDVVRIYYLQQASRDFDSAALRNSKLGTGEDFAYNASLAFMWSAVEVNVGIICACIPTLKPLMKRILPAMITDRTTKARTHSGEKYQSMSSQLGVSPQLFRMESIPQVSTPPQAALPPLSPMGVHSPSFDSHQPAGHREEEEQMDMMDFLTTPAMRQTATVHTGATENTTYFGFVNMKKPKSMMKTHGKESLKYCTMVTILFFLWGFSYGLLNTLNVEIAELANMSESQTIGLTSAYFGGYLLGPLTVGQWVLRHSGFKSTFITGLCIYGVGTLMFWPSAVLTSFPGFLISNIVVGFGLSVLETAANPFLALCGPTHHAEFRLLLAQAVQAVASLLSQLLAEKVLFAGISERPTLIDVQWTYLAVALFTVILSLFFYYTPLPEASDADLQAQSEHLEIYPTRKFPLTGISVIYTTLVFAVLSQALYVGAQECLSSFFTPLLDSRVPASETFTQIFTFTEDNWLLLGHGLFAIGRFLFAPLCLLFPPRILLLISMICLTALSIPIFAIESLSPTAIAGLSLMVFFFEGPVFPIIFASALRGMGAQTKIVASALTAAVSGGSVFAFVMYGVQKSRSVQYSFVVFMVLNAVGMLFPLYLNFFGGEAVKHQVDPRDMRIGRGVWSRGDRKEGDHRPDTPIRRLSERVSFLVQKIAVRRKSSAELPVVEHRERKRGSGEEGGGGEEEV
ncbi:hypothetical protein CJF32_00000332 [Rutstroemia sp. NJR-2017a WRK4]|nr:hypothetical protein CJF32_00000332 [Rutstroemia sp. NJR-2017a WRK4]